MEVYAECIVARQPKKGDSMIKGMWIAFCVVMFFVASFGGILLIPFLLLVCFLAYHFINRMSSMYEYTFLNGEMTFTRMTTNKRKKLFACDMDHVDQVCHHKEFRNPGNAKAFTKVYDVASGVVSNDLYVMTVNTEKGKVKIFFEPDAAFLDAMWRNNPRVVHKARF